MFEMLGGEHTARSVRCLCDFGRVIVYGAATGEAGHLDPRILFAKGARVEGLWLSYLSNKSEVMKTAWNWLAARTGELHPVIGTVLPIEKAAEAYQLLAAGKNFGKIVLKVR